MFNWLIYITLKLQITYFLVLAIPPLKSLLALALPALASPPPEAHQTRHLVRARLRARRAVAVVPLPKVVARALGRQVAVALASTISGAYFAVISPRTLKH